MEDCQIVDLYWRRDGEAIAETNIRYGKYCYTIAWNILSDIQDAEECVNDTWMGAWNAMPVHRPDRLAPFLGKITRSLAFNKSKAKSAGKRGGGELSLALDELEICVPCSSSAEQCVQDAELERLVNQFLYTLPKKDCNIFLRRYWYVEPLTVIAKKYNLKLNTVKTSLYRSRIKLKSYLEKEGVSL